MSFEAIRTASVIRYPYLWAREAESGETEGRKPRPTAVAFRLREPDGDDILILLPITSRRPGRDRLAVAIPEIEKRRGGLEPSMPLWIILDEYNQDIVTRSFYLEPGPPLGQFGKAFFEPIMRRVIAQRRGMSGVNRRG